MCHWRFAEDEWSELLPVGEAQRQLREEMGLSNMAVQPWVRYATPSTVPPRPVELRFTFRVARAPQNGLELVVEGAELFEILLNGKVIPNTTRGWWLDKSMDRVPLPRVRRGENELVLRCEYRDAPEYELEDCYLIGDFGVHRATDAIGAEPATLRPGDWCDQGYPYYTGSMYYGQEVDLHLRRGERAILKVGPQCSGCVALHVNGKLADVRAWPPYQADITRHLKPGRNHIEIELCGSPRNLLGPNRAVEKPPESTRNWVPKRKLVPYGLFGEATIVIVRQ